MSCPPPKLTELSSYAYGAKTCNTPAAVVTASRIRDKASGNNDNKGDAHIVPELSALTSEYATKKICHLLHLIRFYLFELHELTYKLII